MYFFTVFTFYFFIIHICCIFSNNSAGAELQARAREKKFPGVHTVAATEGGGGATTTAGGERIVVGGRKRGLSEPKITPLDKFLQERRKSMMKTLSGGMDGGGEPSEEKEITLEAAVAAVTGATAASEHGLKKKASVPGQIALGLASRVNVSGTPVAAANTLQLDMGIADTLVIRRKNKYIESLKAKAQATIDEATESVSSNNSDGAGGITYFDRSAAPIFIAREKKKKHQLVSKRFEKQSSEQQQPSSRQRHSSEGDEEDSVHSQIDTSAAPPSFASAGGGAGIAALTADGKLAAADEAVVTTPGRGEGGAARPKNNSRGKAAGTAAPAFTAPLVKRKISAEFDMEKFIACCPDADKAIYYEKLDEASRDRLITAMNVCYFLLFTSYVTHSC